MNIFTDEFKEKIDEIIHSNFFNYVMGALTVVILIVGMCVISSPKEEPQKAVQNFEPNGYITTTTTTTSGEKITMLTGGQKILYTGETATATDTKEVSNVDNFIERKITQLNTVVEYVQKIALTLCIIAAMIGAVMMMFTTKQGLGALFIMPLLAYVLISFTPTILPATASWLAS